jgi:hypothetical protein
LYGPTLGLIEITDGVGVAELVLDITDEVDTFELEVVRLTITEEDVDNFDEELVTTTDEVDVCSFDEEVVTTDELDVVGSLELDVVGCEAVVVLIVVQGRTLTVWLKSYIESRDGPPQNSEAFPLQSLNCY